MLAFVLLCGIQGFVECHIRAIVLPPAEQNFHPFKILLPPTEVAQPSFQMCMAWYSFCRLDEQEHIICFIASWTRHRLCDIHMTGASRNTERNLTARVGACGGDGGP